MSTPSARGPRRPGRQARPAMERLVRIVALLRLEDESRGVSRDRLVAAAGYTSPDAGDELLRDLRRLREVGWRIDRVDDGASGGEQARYRLVPGDPRLRVNFTDEERRELRRAAAMAGQAAAREMLRSGASSLDVAATAAVVVRERSRPEALDAVLEALEQKSELRFRYNGRGRLTHPYEVTARQGSWLCIAFEPAAGITKTFDVARMSEVEVGRVGAFSSPVTPVSSSLDPLSWNVDPPMDVVVETQLAYEPDVSARLHEPVTREQLAGAEGVVRLTFRVTNRLVFRARLLSLGPRALIVGPPEIRADFVASLRTVAGGTDGTH